jgi:DNA-binding protein HU-beta
MAAQAKTTTRPVTLKHLAASLAEEHELTKRQGQALLNDLVGLITKHLKKGERIRIAGFGILQVRKRPARMGRNPATGEAIKIKASKKVAFRAAKELKLAVLSLGREISAALLAQSGGGDLPFKPNSAGTKI